jgi:putative mRNA 3-end processing factor
VHIWSAPIRWARRSASSRLIREAGYTEPLYIHGALQKLCDYYQGQGVDLGELLPATVAAGKKGRIRRRHRARPALGLRRQMGKALSRSLITFASGWMQVRARARQRGVELPLVMSDHADWDEVDRHHPRLFRQAKSGSPMAAKRRWCAGANLNQIRAKPLNLVGYEDEGD